MLGNTTSPAAHAVRPPDARLRLREATADLHAQVDGLFARGLDSVAAYRAYVLGMHRFAVDHEIAIGAMPRQSSWLVRDLVALSLPPLLATGRQAPVADHSARLGWEYVMAGSSLGARRLLRDARRLGFTASNGACFLDQHASGEDWTALLARLSACDPTDARRMALAEAGARDAFALVRLCFERSFDTLSRNDAPTTRIALEPRP